MARAYGWDAVLLMKAEASYGVSPGGNFDKMPFISCDYIAADQPLIDDDQLLNRRDPAAPAYDVERVAFTVVVPLELRSIGKWLKQIFGAPTTTGTNPYTHSFTSGLAALAMSSAIEVGLSQVPAYYLKLGCKASGFSVGIGRSGLPQLSIPFMAQSEAKAASSGGGTPGAQPTYTRFKFFEGKVQRAGADFANVTAADLNFNNGLEEINTMRADELIEGFDPGQTRLEGNITTRFAASTLQDDAVANGSVALKYIYTISASAKLTFIIPAAYLIPTRKPLNGPGGVEAAFSWRGAYDATALEMIEVELINDTASY